jgi:hypothetical protein
LPLLRVILQEAEEICAAGFRAATAQEQHRVEGTAPDRASRPPNA